VADTEGKALEAAKAAFESGRLDEAETLLSGAVARGSALAFNDLGALYRHRGRPRQAVPLLLKALEAQPGNRLPRYNLALAFLTLGLYELGWMLFEGRRGIPSLKSPQPGFAFPDWQGEPLAGKRLVVLAEQGLGDQIMFGRYLALALQQGGEVIYLADRALIPLFPGSVETVQRSIAADYWTPQLSLPLRLATGARIPPPMPIDVAQGAGGGVGVVASGSATLGNDRNRSLFGADRERLLKLGRDLSPEATGAKDFLDTARIVAGLDLVITVDTSVAHLAGSMGKSTWILIPPVGTDWRWGEGGETTPWYPSARLYRGTEPGVWGPVLDRIEADVKGLGL
jgi:hypothetical protein